MTNQTTTWTDNTHDDQASNPLNWSPTGTPKPGDTLLLPGGSMIDIQDNDLRGDPLTLSGNDTSPVTLNLSHHARVTLNGTANGPGTSAQAPIIFNVQGSDTLDFTLSALRAAPTTINLEARATLSGSIAMGAGNQLTIDGAKHSRYVNSGVDDLSGSNAVIETRVTGSGTFNLSPGLRVLELLPAFLEFGGSVSSGQTVTLNGTFAGPGPSRFGSVGSTVQIEDPHAFHGTVDFLGCSFADLVSLAGADSWSYKNDMLLIFNERGRTIDKLHVNNDVPGTVHGLSVSFNSTGDVIVTPGTDFHGTLASLMA